MAVFFFTYFPFYQRRRAAAASQDSTEIPRSNFRKRLVVTYAIGAAAALSGWSLLPTPAIAIYVLGIAWLFFLAALGFLFTIRQSGA